VEYPVGVSVGYSETVDLFFPESVSLEAFRAISFYSNDRKHKYDMLSNLELGDQVPVNNSATDSEAAAQVFQ
jgi:hypothetical protein